MDKASTIRSLLRDYLNKEELTIFQFSEISGINSGTLSRIINGNRPISMGQLDRITKAMGLPEGGFFELYVDECLVHSTATWRRLRPFLFRCAELDKLDCINRAVQLITENLSYVPMLFETAEELFRQDKWDAAAILYKSVSESEKYQHSERLAVCQYRLFMIALGDDQEENLRAATLFECYVDRLDEVDQLDALKHLANVFISLHRWNKADELARRLHRLAKMKYEEMLQGSKWMEEAQRKLEIPLFSYVLYSHLIRSFICAEHGDYKTALNYIKLYADGSWVVVDTDEARITLEQFKEWATANTYLYRVMSGEKQALTEYVEYISTRKDEIFIALFKILQAANRYQYYIDDILERFSSYFPYKTYRNGVGNYNKQIMSDKYAQFLYELAVYYLNHKRSEGMDVLLQSLNFSVKINNEKNIIKCVGLFEQFRHMASIQAEKDYKTLISEVQRLNEKKVSSIDNFI